MYVYKDIYEYLFSRGEDFRPEFRDLEITCSILADKPILALTATANQKIVDDIFKFLTLPTETEVIAVIPNRYTLHTKQVIYYLYTPKYLKNTR